MKGLRAAAFAFTFAGIALVAVPSVALAQAVPVYAESPADALARNVRILAENPKNFTALLSAGKAALRLGDEQAAAGFFGRAEEISPGSPLPKAGMGAALVAIGDPRSALSYFARAQQLGATPAGIGCDRGLAYDLLGQQVAAQTDYRAALSGPDRDEARRRLALSLAISGEKELALSTLKPLLQRRDVAAHRVRALVHALTGDWVSAKAALDNTMPGTAAYMGPFFRQLPALASAQKAAAVHLGIFPDSGIAVASARPVGAMPYQSRQTSTHRAPTRRSSPPVKYSYAAPAPTAEPRQAPIQTASISKWSLEDARSSDSDLIETARVKSSPGGKKIWLQLASGTNAADLPDQFRMIRAREPSLFDGISGYVANDDSRARLVIGPFHSEEDARLFGLALETARINSFRWVSQPGQVVRKLPTQ